MDGDGIPDIAVSAAVDDDTASNDGAIYVLFMNTDGTVRAGNKINETDNEY